MSKTQLNEHRDIDKTASVAQWKHLAKYTCQRASVALAGVLCLVFSSGAGAADMCSSAIGSINLNEYNYIDNFAEIKKINSSTNLSGWTVTIYTSTKTTVKNLPSTGSSSCYGDLYQYLSFAPNEIGTNADVAIKDSAGDVVDLLRVRTSLPVTTKYYSASPVCSFTGTTTDLLVTSGSKGADRLPDGTGDWRQTPGTGSNSFQSQCGPNIVGGRADLSITKTVNLATVVRGNNVIFTVLVINRGIGVANSVQVSDLLPAGFSYVSSSVTVGGYVASSGLWTIGNMAVNGTASLTLTAITTLVGTLTNTATVASSTFDPITTDNTAAVNVTVTSPGATLDAVEVSAAAGTSINTKLAATAFSLDVLALAADGSISTGYNKAVTIELVDVSTGASCATMPLLQSVVTVLFNGSGSGKDNGRKTVSFTYNNAGANVRVRMRDNSATPITACSTDNFAIRPKIFTVSSDASNTLTTGAPAIKAGANFSLKANSGVGSGYSGTPILETTLVRDHNAATAGTLTGSFGVASGVSALGTFQYHDVGSISLLVNAVRDAMFTTVDQAAGCVVGSTSNTLSGGKYGCDIGSTAAGPFGRFYPDHFIYTASLTPACAAGNFSYMDQASLGINLSLTAKSSNETTTTRYTAAYATLGTFAIAGDNAGTAVAASRLNPALPAFAWSSGLYTTNATRAFSRNATPDGPYDSFALKASVTDPDGALLTGAAVSNTTRIRFGRLKLGNVYGSELLNLSVPVQVQYWSGTAFALNSLDACTTLATANLKLTGAPAGVTATASGIFAAGAGSINVSKPSPATAATIELCIDAGPDPVGGTVCAASASASAAFLQGLWFPGTAYNNDPGARATFGIYKGNNNLIYQRENY
jgi:uncharacterized repeat protein (TIGR01451 family)